MKKLAIFLICFFVGICLVFSMIYKADLARMANNEPVIFSTWGFDYADETETESREVNTNDPVYIVPVEGTITSRGMVIDIVNNSDDTVYFGDYFAIEKRKGDSWKKLNYITSGSPDWNDVTYIIEPGGTVSFSYYWADMYGELEEGDYRIVKLYFDDTEASEIMYLYGGFRIKQ